MSEEHSLNVTKRSKVFAWVRITMLISLAFLVAYGVVRVPNRTTHPGIQKVLLLYLSEPDHSAQLMTESFMSSLKEKPLGEGVQVELLSLPSERDQMAQTIREAIQKNQPELTLAFGVSEGSQFKLEVQAFNEVENKAPVIAGAPPKHLSRLSIHELQRRLEKAGYPAVISYSAGSPQHNFLFYQLIHIVYHPPSLKEPESSQRVLAGFVHVPETPKDGSKTPEQWGQWGADAVRLILETALQ